jgi:hypothetical protein
VLYVKVEGDMHFPLFEGDTAPLSAKAVTLQGWQLARLRFLHSVRPELVQLQGGGLAKVVGLAAVLAHCRHHRGVLAGERLPAEQQGGGAQGVDRRRCADRRAAGGGGGGNVGDR